jgi:hypothetical protein
VLVVSVYIGVSLSLERCRCVWCTILFISRYGLSTVTNSKYHTKLLLGPTGYGHLDAAVARRTRIIVIVRSNNYNIYSMFLKNHQVK